MLDNRANAIALSEYANTQWTVESPYYYKLSGTSMAAAVVSGAVALLLDKDDTLTPDTIKARLMLTAGKTFPSFSTAIDAATEKAFVTQNDVFTVGAGYVDVWAALHSGEIASKPALSPVATYCSKRGPHT